MGSDPFGLDLYPPTACPTLGGDTDLDGILDLADNCSEVANPDQADSDRDFIGNVCGP